MGTPPRVSKDEFSKELQSALIGKGFSEDQRSKVAMMLRGDLHEGDSYQDGIDAKEIDRALSWMRANMSKHNLSSKRLDDLEEALRALL